MIRVIIEFDNGWYDLTKEFLDKFKTNYGLISYKVEIIKEDKKNA